MRVLLTGATGVIGRRVVPLLVRAGHAVTAVTRRPAPEIERVGARCEQADLFDLDALKRAARDHDAIVNLATHMPSSSWKMMLRSAWRLNDRIRREGSANIVDAALSAGVPRVVQESFAMTYPDGGSNWIDERTPLAPSDYNRTVLDAEMAVERFTASGGTGVALRFAAFYGPDAMQLRTYIRSLRMGWAPLPGSRDGYIPSLSHDDAASAVIAALDVPAGAYTVTDDEPVTRDVYFGSLAHVLGVRSPRFLPQWITPLLGSVGDAMARSLRLSNRTWRHAAGWAPRFPSVRQGWPETIDRMGAA